MGQAKRPLVVLGALVLVLVLGVVGQRVLLRGGAGATPTSAASDGADSAEARDVYLLADFDATVYTESGEPRQLTDIADSRPLVINFWATWCPYCVDELPDFQQIVAEYGDAVSFAFVDVADGQRERVEDAKAWLVERGFDDLPAYYDTSLEASMMYGASALPTTVVVAADGEIRSVSAGRIDPTLLRASLRQLV